MRYVLIALVAMGVSCGPPPTASCCSPVIVSRNFGYVGSFVSDAGSTTQVQLVVNASGVATVSFVRGGDQIVQTFQTTQR